MQRYESRKEFMEIAVEFCLSGNPTEITTANFDKLNSAKKMGEKTTEVYSHLFPIQSWNRELQSAPDLELLKLCYLNSP